MPNALLLVPGIGAQGATISDVRAHFGRHYSRVIPSISRAIAGAGPAAGDLRRAVERHIAEGSLVASNNRAKTAILMLKRKIGRAQAEALITKSGNSLRKALTAKVE